MPIYKARLNRDAGGSWVASSVELPNCWSRASTREEALGKLRDEIRYRIEYCPCSGVDEEFVRVELQALPEAHGVAPPPAAVPVETPTGSSPAGSTPPQATSRREWTAARPAVPASLSGDAGCPPPGREPSRPVSSPKTSRQAPGASEPDRTAVPHSPGWRRWDD